MAVWAGAGASLTTGWPGISGLPRTAAWIGSDGEDELEGPRYAAADVASQALPAAHSPLPKRGTPG